MPRVTRQSLASKKEEDAVQPALSGGKRGSKKPEPVVEPESIGEPAPSKTTRRGKGTAAKEDPPKGKMPSRGRGKKQEEPEEEIEESPSPKRGRGRSKKDDVEEKVEEVPATKRGTRGGRGKKEEEPDQEEEVVLPAKRPARGGRGKKVEEPDDSDDEEEELPPPKRAARGGRVKKEESADEEEEDLPPPKRAARGGRGKKEEQKIEGGSTPEKPSPRGRGRSSRGSKGSQPKEVNEEKEAEEEEAQDVSKSTPEKTPTGGGRRGRGKKEDMSPSTKTPTPTKQLAVVEETPESDKQVEEEPKHDEEKSEDNMEAESEDKAESGQKEEMDIEPEAKPEQSQAHDENMEAEEKVEVGKKRKLEDSEEESSPKKARISEPDGSKDEDISAVSDYVVINKEDVPAADSKEVEAALPPQVEDEKQKPAEMDTADTTPPPNTNADAAPPKMSAPSNVVPLTEAELAKQYNPTIRDRDENSSMMVEVGSEAASDVGSVSRNLDVSEMAAVEQAGQDDSVASSDVSELSTSSKPTESTSTTPSLSNKISAQESASSVVEMTSIPLPAEKSSPATYQQTELEKPSAVLPSATLNQSTPATITAQPSNPQTTAPPIQVISIPMPPDSNNSSSDISSAVPSRKLLPPPVPVAQPSQNATAQNGSCKPSENVAQSTPLHTSTPAKKPITLDSNYVPSSPSITKRKFISNHSFPIELMDPAFCFSVVSYNILADCHLRRYDYSYTEAQYLDLSYRHTLFMKELEYLDGDIVCMQEVDTKYYSDVLLSAMTSRGYQGMFKKRTQDWYDEGEATFVKTSKFEVLSYDGISLKDLAYEEIAAAGLTGDVSRAAKKYVDRADVVLVCKLLSKRTGKHLTVGNIHVAFDPKSPDLQCIQVASAVKELVSKAGSDLNPYIICGDFNSETTTPAYQLAKDGYLTDEHIRVLQNIQSMDNAEGTSKSIIHYLWKAFQHTSSNMKSAYETTVGKEPVITSMNGLVKACLDYIFYSSSTLYTVGAMEVIDPQVVEATGGLPSKDIPSDHLSVKAVFRLKD